MKTLEPIINFCFRCKVLPYSCLNHCCSVSNLPLTVFFIAARNVNGPSQILAAVYWQVSLSRFPSFCRMSRRIAVSVTIFRQIQLLSQGWPGFCTPRSSVACKVLITLVLHHVMGEPCHDFSAVALNPLIYLRYIELSSIFWDGGRA